MMTAPTPTQPIIIDARPGRWLAQCVVIDGHEHPLSIVEISTVDGDSLVSVSPFCREIHSTSYFNGTITILRSPLRLIFEP